MHANESDTIAAIATPLGEGGISVIRLSGPDAISLSDNHFRAGATSRSPLQDAASHSAHFGRFVGVGGETLDEVVALVFREPNSYTGENVVEISCHGGLLVTRRILQAVLDSGARLAEPGEFTKRAFLNGKLDLSQAEAVADLIHAGSELAHRSSLQQLEGKLSSQVNSLRDQLIETVGLLELELDFVEDHLEFLDKNKVSNQVEKIINNLRALAETYQTGKVYREGVKVVLAGAPNVGKSSILNSLLSENRAIVTDVPGTTRDSIEENLNIGGLLFRVVDTAGLRETADLVEQEGVKRTESQIQNCDVLVLVFDTARQLSRDEVELARKFIERTRQQSRASLVVINKSDLPPVMNGELTEQAPFLSTFPVARISALTGSGMDGLKNMLVDSVLQTKGRSSDASVTVTNARHHAAIKSAEENLGLALASLKENQSNELVAIDLRAALDRLGEITGAVTTDDILNNIFSKFCIGK
ncbi:MAG TPA: tRNA uridine-5-carboxymethylaminomethyl(34) synthesis GTPase MnmE [Bacteroidota bacterium]